jgi:mannose-6-phosphate isomerase
MNRLKPVVKSYDWGSSENCLAKKFCKINDEATSVIAECWFGSHPLGHAQMVVDKQTVPLPNFDFMTKLLNINKPLSIQVHPNKQNAVRLNGKNPLIYTDANEKPEIIIALTKVVALCGISSLHTIRENLQLFKNDFRLTSKQQFIRHILSLSPEKVGEILLEVQCVKKENRVLSAIWNLHRFYPNDPGVLAPLFMNIVELEPYMALVIPPQTLHAYVHGEGLEVMASSDNVVRAGLTNKAKDLKTFFSITNFFSESPIVIEKNEVYRHPCFSEYFSIRLLENTGTVNVKPNQTFAFVVAGWGIVNGKICKLGDSFLVNDDVVHIFGIVKVIVVCATEKKVLRE